MYWVLLAISYIMLPIVFPSFKKKKHSDVINIAGPIVSTINDVGAVVMATYTVLNLCDYPLAMFYGEKECLGNWRNFYGYAVAWSIGYFTYDIGMMLYVFEWGGSFFV